MLQNPLQYITPHDCICIICRILSNDCLVTVAPLLLDLQGKLVNLRRVHCVSQSGDFWID